MIKQKIGQLLCEAHIINKQQLQVALVEKNLYPELKVGEILALHGWLQEKTADFFGSEVQAINQEQHLLIGNIFLRAGLLSETDIQNILQEQKQIGSRFGETAVLKGLLKKETVDFFLNRFALYKDKQNFDRNKKQQILNNSGNHKVDESLNGNKINGQVIDPEDIPWID